MYHVYMMFALIIYYELLVDSCGLFSFVFNRLVFMAYFLRQPFELADFCCILVLFVVLVWWALLLAWNGL